MKLLPISIGSLFILSFVAFGGTVYLSMQLETGKKLQLELTEDKKRLETSLSEKDQLLKSAKQEFKGEMMRLKSDMDEKAKEITKNRKEMAQWETQLKELNEKIRVLEKENKSLTARLDRVKSVSTAQSVSTQLVSTGTVSAGTVLSTQPSKGQPLEVSPIEGKVILVNKEYEFVVVGLGKLDGVKINDRMDIVRDGSLIGKVTVSKLYDSLSSCDMVQGQGAAIQEGDLVRMLAG